MIKLKDTYELMKMAELISMHVRNSMEDFHIKHLSDEQMKELNPIIRNSIYTVIYSVKEALNDDKRSIDFLNYLHLMIPTYWENPKINDNYLKG